MDPNNLEVLPDPGGDPAAAFDHPESLSPEKEQGGGSSCAVAEEQSSRGYWSQTSISRSLQRAESLLRSTLNPSLRWLFHSPSQDEEEGNLVVAPNLVSRSSARLLRLQQALLMAAPHWQLPAGGHMRSVQLCVKSLPGDDSVFLQSRYRCVWSLLEQRALLLFIHEYTRRARLASAYISRLAEQLQQQSSSSRSSSRLPVSSLVQELRVHLTHWSCLSSRVQSDQYLRLALAGRSGLLEEIQQHLDCLSLQALVLMERYVSGFLSAVARTDPGSVPRGVLEEMLAGAELYNQAAEEQKGQHGALQRRTAVLQQAQLPRMPGLSAFTVKELLVIFAMHQADMAAQQLWQQVSEQSRPVCPVHNLHPACSSSSSCRLLGRLSVRRSDWTWKQLQQAYLPSSSLCSSSSLLSSPGQTYRNPVAQYVPHLHLDSSNLGNHPVRVPLPSVQHQEEAAKSDPTSQCLSFVSQSDPSSSSLEASDTVQHPPEHHSKPFQTLPPPPASAPAHPLPAAGPLNQHSAGILLQVLLSSNDLLAALATSSSQFPAEAPPTEALLTEAPPTTAVEASDRKADSAGSNSPVPTAAGTVVLEGVSPPLDSEQDVEKTLESSETEMTSGSSGLRSSGGAEREDSVPVRWPHSVQWLDLGRSLALAELLETYRPLVVTLCTKALWLHLFFQPPGGTAESINLQDSHRGFQVHTHIRQLLGTGVVPTECKTMLEDFSVNLLVITAHTHWDYVLCRCLGTALKDKCVNNQGLVRSSADPLRMEGVEGVSKTMELLLLLPPPLLSSISCQQPDSSSSGGSSVFPSRLRCKRQTVSMVVSWVQLSSVWVLSKAYQFLSSWYLNRFLLITQGDLKMLKQSLEMLMGHIQSSLVDSDAAHHSILQKHQQLLLSQQLGILIRAGAQLQNFSSLLLRNFSSDCKRMSGEIFEQTMPPAVHWRPGHRTGLPSSPSEYACLAAQTVIGQVLEGVAPLPDDARVQALSITMTAFMEAWMEHILRQKIKFSVDGALQLKQDFDSIREMIRSDRFGLSSDLHQRLLSLRYLRHAVPLPPHPTHC